MWLCCLVLAWSVGTFADEARYRIRYTSGHAGETQRFWGQLVVAHDALRFERIDTDWRGRHPTATPVFAVPFASIVSVTDDIVRRAFLIVNTEAGQTAEAIRFEVIDRPQAESLRATIQLAAKQARARAAVK